MTYKCEPVPLSSQASQTYDQESPCGKLLSISVGGVVKPGTASNWKAND